MPVWCSPGPWRWPMSLGLLVACCIECGRWKKWVAADFYPHQNKDALIKICGHYVFNRPRFKEMKKAWPGFDAEAKRRNKHRIREIVE